MRSRYPNLCAEDLGLDLGDTLLLLTEENPLEYTVCGIYSDITNGGKTAKATFLPSGVPMWSVFYVSLKEGVPKEQWLSACTQALSDIGISARAVDIREYVTDTYGQTIQEVRMAARAAVLAAALVMFVVVVLFTRLLVAEDRNDISLRKALGFTGRDIRRLYFLRYLPVLLAGILAGIASGDLLGGTTGGSVLKDTGGNGLPLPDRYSSRVRLDPRSYGDHRILRRSAGAFGDQKHPGIRMLHGKGIEKDGRTSDGKKSL